MAKYEAIPVIVDAYVITATVFKETYGVKTTNVMINGMWVLLTPEMTSRYTPKAGDYYVVQADHYIYINPKEVFERKYKAMN